MPTPKTKAKPGVSIIGCGRLGTALAIALSHAGYEIDALVGLNRRRAQTAVMLLDVPCRPLAFKELDKLPASGLVIIAVPDDQIGRVAQALAHVTESRRKARTALHTSGALSSCELESLAEKGWQVGSLHPLVAVSEPTAGAKALQGAFWCLEGDKGFLRVARKIVRNLNGQTFSISAEQKPLYHAAAVMASGNMVALFDVALEMLSRCGLSLKEGQRILLPLVESAIRNLHQSDPSRALTGSIARGDLATVKRHLKALSVKGLSDALELYRLLGRRAVKLAAKNDVDPRALRRIAKAMGNRER